MGQPLLESQLEAVRTELRQRPPGLVAHVERVLIEALALARTWALDPVRTELATWGHDLYRSFPPEELLRLARDSGVPISGADARSPVMLHGPIAAAVLRERFRVRDREVLEAVRDHTVGLANMPLLGKVILLADKFEKRKRERTPVMKAIRRLAHRDLDLALLCWADWKWVEERSQGWESHPAHWRARRRWVREHHRDLAAR